MTLTASFDTPATDDAALTTADMLAGIAKNKATARAEREWIDGQEGGIEAFRAGLTYQSVITDEQHATVARFYEAFGYPEEFSTDLPSSEAINQFILNAPPAEQDALIQLQAETQAVFDDVVKNIDTFYEVFEQCFPLDEERAAKESLQSLILQANFNPELLAEGAFREYITIVRDPAGDVIGGTNFIVYVPDTPVVSKQATYASTIQDNYLFLRPENRSMGLLPELMGDMANTALAFVQQVHPEHLDTATHIGATTEQNIAADLDDQSYKRDSRDATEQCERREAWARYGMKTMLTHDNVKFYNQPGLTGDDGVQMDPCTTLDYAFAAIKIDRSSGQPRAGKPDPTVDSLPADLMAWHITRFFTGSVLEDANALNPETGDVTGRAVIDLLRGEAAKGDGTLRMVDTQETITLHRYLKPAIHEFLRYLDARGLDAPDSIAERYTELTGRDIKAEAMAKTQYHLQLAREGVTNPEASIADADAKGVFRVYAAMGLDATKFDVNARIQIEDIQATMAELGLTDISGITPASNPTEFIQNCLQAAVNRDVRIEESLNANGSTQFTINNLFGDAGAKAYSNAEQGRIRLKSSWNALRRGDFAAAWAISNPNKSARANLTNFVPVEEGITLRSHPTHGTPLTLASALVREIAAKSAAEGGLTVTDAVLTKYSPTHSQILPQAKAEA